MKVSEITKLGLIVFILSFSYLAWGRRAQPQQLTVEQSYELACNQYTQASIYDSVQPTASGAILNPRAKTAAHKFLPLGTRLKVYNLNRCNEDDVRQCPSVEVLVNDKGPFIKGRDIDLTPGSAKAMGFSKKQGVTNVFVECLPSI